MRKRESTKGWKDGKGQRKKGKGKWKWKKDDQGRAKGR
jgi:hypothetical protein